jgi:hypothetical protein
MEITKTADAEATELQNKAQETANAVAETEIADSELENIAGGIGVPNKGKDYQKDY